MNCFIASAFGYKEVDEIYERAIVPVLKEFQINPIRIDRVEHNDDIDDQIFKMLDQSDLCIADLTYARPSVYYESGYAFGHGKPVIYIARNDHFRVRENDIAGNFRVHFDLQMKNIIAWTVPNKTFKQSLRRRIKHVISPIQNKLQAAKSKREDEQRFASLSLNDRFIGVLDKGEKTLSVLGFEREKLLHSSMNYARDPHYRQFHKAVGRKFIQVHFVAKTSVNKTAIQIMHFYWSTAPYRKYDQIYSLCVFAITGRIRPATLVSLLPSWTPIANGIFSKQSSAGYGREIPQILTVAFIDAVKSLEDFVDRFDALLKRFHADNKLRRSLHL